MPDEQMSDGKGTMFSGPNPWSPRQSTWSSPQAGSTGNRSSALGLLAEGGYHSAGRLAAITTYRSLAL